MEIRARGMEGVRGVEEDWGTAFFCSGILVRLFFGFICLQLLIHEQNNGMAKKKKKELKSKSSLTERETVSKNVSSKLTWLPIFFFFFFCVSSSLCSFFFTSHFFDCRFAQMVKEGNRKRLRKKRVIIVFVLFCFVFFLSFSFPTLFFSSAFFFFFFFQKSFKRII